MLLRRQWARVQTRWGADPHADALDPTKHDKFMLAVGVLWIASVLSIDSDGSPFGVKTQWIIGAFTWVLLIARCIWCNLW